MDNLSIKSVAKFSQYVLIRATIYSLHEITTKEDICKHYQRSYSHLKRFLASYGSCSFVLRFYFNYIFFVNGFNVDLCKQVQELSCLVLNHEANEHILAACYCLSTFYCWRKDLFEAYILFLEKFLLKTLLQTDGNIFSSYYSSYVIVEAYLLKKKNKMVAIYQIFAHINKLFNMDASLFCKTNSNFIIAIQLILRHSATNCDEKLIFKCVYLASFLIDKCSHYFSLFFKRDMVYLSYFFAK